MNKAWKVFIVCVTVIVCAILVYDQVTIRKLKKDNQIQAVKIMMANDTATVYRTKSGEAYFKLNSVLIEKNASKASLDEMGIQAKGLKEKNVDLNDIIQVLRGQLASSGHGTITLHDTIYKFVNKPQISLKTFDWNNKYLYLKGEVYSDNRIEADYLYKTDLIATTEHSGGKSIVTISISDPNARIISGSQIVVTPSVKFWDHWYFYVLAGMAGGIYLAK